MQHLEPSCETLGETLLNQEWRRAEQYDFEAPPGPGVLIPESLDGLGPADSLLHLVEHEDGGVTVNGQARGFPLLSDPSRAAQGRFIGAGKADRQSGGLADLLHQRGLAHLAGSRHDLDEPSRLAQAPCEYGGAGAPGRLVPGTHRGAELLSMW